MRPSPGDVVERWDHWGAPMTPYVVVALAFDESLEGWVVDLFDVASGDVHPFTLPQVLELCQRQRGAAGLVSWRLVPSGSLP